MIIREKTPAKINLTLDVLGIKDNYHMIESLVASINVFDAITLTKRKDKRVKLRVRGNKIDCPTSENNAVKAASLFVKTFGTKGVNVTINKKIPVAGGLGGSSADIAGVLNGMKKLYGIDADVKALADSLGSDAGYMLSGGYAVIKDRGTEVESLKISTPIYIILITSKAKVSAKSCYQKYDQLKLPSLACTAVAEKYLSQGKIKELALVMKNDLQPAAESLADITLPILALKESGAMKVLVSGSGPTVYGVFSGKSARDEAYKKLVPLFKKRAIKAETIPCAEN